MVLNSILNEDFFDDIDVEIEDEKVEVESKHKRIIFEIYGVADTLYLKYIDDMQFNMFIDKIKSYLSFKNSFDVDNDDIKVDIYTLINKKNTDAMGAFDRYTEDNKIDL